MRIKLDNRTQDDVLPYLKLAAKVINGVHREVHTVVKYGRGYHGWHGRAWPGRVDLFIPRRERFTPFKRTRRFNQEMPTEANTWEELVVGLAAHEFGHQNVNGYYGRRVCKERHAERKWTDAVELLRSAEGQAFIADAQRAAQERASRAAAKSEYRKSSDYKLARLLERQKQWTTRAKRAATALRKLQRQIARLEKQRTTIASEQQVERVNNV